jgi:hypothetical protein
MSNDIDWQKIFDEINNPTEEQRKEREEKEANKTNEEKIERNKKMMEIVNLMQWNNLKVEKSIKKHYEDENARIKKEIIKDKLDSI